MSLAVATIDQVALAMGVSAGMLYETALEYVAGQAARQHPDDGDTIWAAVAGRVLDGLISDSPHEAVYAAHDGDIVHRRVHPFRLLYEQWSADESVHLRASDQAINMLVDALDLDVTSAQVAAEVQMRVLIERNALAGAVSLARRARYQSIQYLERVRTVVRDTSIDPDALILMAMDLNAWTQRLCLDGPLATAEPKKFRYRIWHIAGRIVTRSNRCETVLQDAPGGLRSGRVIPWVRAEPLANRGQAPLFRVRRPRRRFAFITDEGGRESTVGAASSSRLQAWSDACERGASVG